MVSDMAVREVLTAYMAMPVVHSVKNSTPMSRLASSSHGIMGFCQGILLATAFPGTKRRSQKRKAADRMIPRIRDTSTGAETQGYVAPAHVRPRMMSPKPSRKSRSRRRKKR